ncbi:hypothetical protein RF11_09451 [Thelohanellus kitauei]|uniref:Reverse transcriptase domain-containing protein n=1 Tax=Thelohanellus kitauei TaxID=669202 RepID=A0A0C2ITQ1_THEKT|nr:hypothetical protein RF11_09451 [Thelohanellus kitauei]
MNRIFKGLPFARTYIDDLIIFSWNESEHINHLDEIEEIKVWSKPAKIKRLEQLLVSCNFYRKSITKLADVNLLINAPALASPSITILFEVTTNAIDYALGVTLAQNGKPIGFMKIPPRLNAQIINRSQTSFLAQSRTEGKLYRWALILQEFDFDIKCVISKMNKSDELSRINYDMVLTGIETEALMHYNLHKQYQLSDQEMKYVRENLKDISR